MRAVKFILYTMVGSLLMLLAILYLFFANGGVDLRSDADLRQPGFGSTPAYCDARSSGSSWHFFLPSRSRCRSFPSTPGCRMRTSRLRRPAPSFWPACC